VPLVADGACARSLFLQRVPATVVVVVSLLRNDVAWFEPPDKNTAKTNAGRNTFRLSLGEG
jgi:hypothetical protein